MERKFDDFVKTAREEQGRDEARRRSEAEVASDARRGLNQRSLETRARAQRLIPELHKAVTAMQSLAGSTVGGRGKKFGLRSGFPEPPRDIHVGTRSRQFLGTDRGWWVGAPSSAPMAVTGHRGSGLAACRFFVPLRGAVEVQPSRPDIRSPGVSAWMSVASLADEGYREWVQHDTEGRSCTLHADAEEHMIRFMQTVAQYVAALGRSS
jgi:hypothetical protein